MIQLELTPEEGAVLREILEDDFSDLRMEIAGTENMDYREMLKKKEVFLIDILKRLKTD